MKQTYANTPLQMRFGADPLAAEQARRATAVFIRQRLSAPSLAEVTFSEPGKTFVDGLSLGTAWATLGHAANVVNPGDTVHVENGNYQAALPVLLPVLGSDLCNPR